MSWGSEIDMVAYELILKNLPKYYDFDVFKSEMIIQQMEPDLINNLHVLITQFIDESISLP